jgi:hypothetical protein
MDTLLYVGQIVVGTTLLAAALALSGRLRARLGKSGTSVRTYADVEVAGVNCLFGVFLAVAAITFGVTGLAGLPVLPAPVGVLVTGVGLISVLLAIDTTPLSYRVVVDGVSVVPVPRTGTELTGVIEFSVIPSRAGSDAASRHAA